MSERGFVIMNEKGILGKSGEEAAAKYLRRSGYVIAARNFRCAPGEVDIIAYAKEPGIMCFVEVKTRSSDCCGRPAEAVTPEKQRHIMRAAEFYMIINGIYGRTDMRFDVIEAFADNAEVTEKKHFTVNHIIGAFGEGW